jgi:hypothetical protein
MLRSTHCVSELFPVVWSCVSTVNQYGNSRGVPNMQLSKSAGGLGPTGNFWLFTAITLIGGVWAWFFIPETAGSVVAKQSVFKLLRREGG